MSNVIDAHESTKRVRNALARMRMKATRSAVDALRADVDEVFDEETQIAETELETLLRLAVGEAVSA